MTKEKIKILEENKKLIYSIIKKYGKNIEFEDAWQVATIGILDAYKNYKDTYNTKFSTYAYSYIFGEIQKFKNQNKAIKLSKDYQKLGKKINEAKNILTQKLMKEPTNKELALFLEIEESLINEIDLLNKGVDSLDRQIDSGDNSLYLYDVIAKDDGQKFDSLILKEQLNMLSKDEYNLIIDRYYLDKTQTETSSHLGINQVQVSRYEQKILKKIRKNMENTVKK